MTPADNSDAERKSLRAQPGGDVASAPGVSMSDDEMDVLPWLQGLQGGLPARLGAADRRAIACALGAACREIVNLRAASRTGARVLERLEIAAWLREVAEAGIAEGRWWRPFDLRRRIVEAANCMALAKAITDGVHLTAD